MKEILGSIIVRARSGRSVLRETQRISAFTVKDFLATPSLIDQVENRAVALGLRIVGRSDAVLTFAADAAVWQAAFGSRVRMRRRTVRIAGRDEEVMVAVAAGPLSLAALGTAVEAVHFVCPGVPFHAPVAPVPSPTYYHLQLTDVRTHLHADAAHAAGVTGAGVRVSLVDTGIVTRVREVQPPTSVTTVVVDHPIRRVTGVWLETSSATMGTNYSTGGSFLGQTITLGTALPEDTRRVLVCYSCLHPYYSANGCTVDSVLAVPGQDAESDELGHGTAVATNIFAVAPDAVVSCVAGMNLVGFQLAEMMQKPAVLSCSWGTLGFDPALHLEIAYAVANGMVVVFAAGNGHDDDAGSMVEAVAHPDVISVGGAFPISGGGFRASNYAGSFDSFRYTDPQRHSPDVVGLVGDGPSGVLIMMPTQPESMLDRQLASGTFPEGDNTATSDGWLVASGTSSACAQAAGASALVLQRYPGLSPVAVKNILENTARDVTMESTRRGSYNTERARLRWDAKTGFGLIDAGAAIHYLKSGSFNVYMRDSVEDSGPEPIGGNRSYASPDIIVRNATVADPQGELGMILKHHDDLSDDIEEGQDHSIYLRIQNRGTVAGDCMVMVYCSPPGMIGQPLRWIALGTVDVTDLQPGELRVVGPLVWEGAGMAMAGQCCLIGILDSAVDPAPNLKAVRTEADFAALVRDHGNVTWKNIEVASVAPGGSSSFEFGFEGPSGPGHRVDLRLTVDPPLPALGSVIVRMFKRLADPAIKEDLKAVCESSHHRAFRLEDAEGSFRAMPLHSRERAKATIYVSLHTNSPNGSYRIRAEVLVDGASMGGYTQVVNVSGATFVGNRRSRDLHRRGCPFAAKVSAYNRELFFDESKATRQGYSRCAVCLGGSRE